ncbi:hypothetical protein V8C86DRAFT_3129583 [Haematococcus lacustris]
MDASATDPPVRRKLNLKPRDENAAQKAEEARLARSGSNPFGAALPREAVLAHRTGKTEQSILREEGRREQLRLRLTPQQAEEKEGLEALVKEARSQVLAAEDAPEAEQAAMKQQLESRQAALDDLIDQFAKAALLAAEKGEVQRPSERRALQLQHTVGSGQVGEGPGPGALGVGGRQQQAVQKDPLAIWTSLAVSIWVAAAAETQDGPNAWKQMCSWTDLGKEELFLNDSLLTCTPHANNYQQMFLTEIRQSTSHCTLLCVWLIA